MTLQELQSNQELRNHEFPVTRQKIYLAHAGVCALPRRVHDSISSYIQRATLADQEFVLPATWLKETRQLAANFLGVGLDEVAFVGPTSNALSFIAGGLRFKRNHNVLIYHDDYPSNVYPWMTLADRGVEVHFLNIRELGVIRARDVIGQVDENTRLVALASCHFLAGYRIDLDTIGKFLRERGILFCVDAIQTFGAFPTSLKYVDFAAADAHKWLLGPCAAGLMYVRKEMQDELHPTTQGWHNVRNPNFVAQEQIEYKQDARRYEAGSHNLLGLVGLRASMELLAGIGVENIARDLIQKRQWVVPELKGKGYSILNDNTSPETGSGIITFTKVESDIPELHGRLQQNNIVTSLRTDRQNRRYIRLSPHFYNTDAELRRVLEFL
jgi:cysteine desulfurase / selenocysteine lyase